MQPRQRRLVLGLAVAVVAVVAIGIAASSGVLPGGTDSPAAITRPPSVAASASVATSASGGSPWLSSGAVTAVPACRAATLAASELSDSRTRVHSPGMNHHGLTVSVINIGRSACSLSGYLGVGMYDGAGRLVSARTVTRGGSQYADDAGPRPLVLGPGTAAFADLAWSSATGRTPEVAVAELRVIAPGDTVQLRVPLQATLGADFRISETALSALPAPLRG